jgi:hypothetical protein
LADVEHKDESCTFCGPSWWGTLRGCYVAAQARYADPKVRVTRGHIYREVITGCYPNTERPFIEQEEI